MDQCSAMVGLNKGVVKSTVFQKVDLLVCVFFNKDMIYNYFFYVYNSYEGCCLYEL